MEALPKSFSPKNISTHSRSLITSPQYFKTCHIIVIGPSPAPGSLPVSFVLLPPAEEEPKQSEERLDDSPVVSLLASEKSNSKPWEYTLRNYRLLMGMVAAFLKHTPPGGVWQDTGDGHLAGDTIIRDTHYRRYLVFLYCNATAFVVIVLILRLFVLHENFKENIWRRTTLLPLWVVMVLGLLSLMCAYAASTCRDAVTSVYISLVVAAVLAYVVVQTARALASAPEKRTAADPPPPTSTPASAQGPDASRDVS